MVAREFHQLINNYHYFSQWCSPVKITNNLLIQIFFEEDVVHTVLIHFAENWPHWIHFTGNSKEIIIYVQSMQKFNRIFDQVEFRHSMKKWTRTVVCGRKNLILIVLYSIFYYNWILFELLYEILEVFVLQYLYVLRGKWTLRRMIKLSWAATIEFKQNTQAFTVCL